MNLTLDLTDYQRNMNSELSLIIEILFLYNPRISEVLSLRKKDIIENRFAILHGRKKSADIIIRDRKIISNLISLSSLRHDSIFIYMSYAQIYRYCKKNFSHLIRAVAKQKNNKVTHVFRYINSNGVLSEESLKQMLHHNSVRSNHFYKNKTKRN